MFPPQPVRSGGGTRLVVIALCVLLFVGVKMYQSFQLSRFDQYTLPQASYFAHPTNLAIVFIDNPTDIPGKEHMYAGTNQDKEFVMQLGHLVLDNASGGNPLDRTTPLVDFRVYRGASYIDVLVCSQAKEFWIVDSSADVPPTPIEPGFSRRTVASGHFDNVAGQMSALISRATPPAASDDNSGDSPVD